MKKNTKHAGLLLWITILLTALVVLHSNNISIGKITEKINSILEDSGFLAPLVYVIFYTIRPFTLLPATILTVLAGVVFGAVYGTIYTIIGATTSAITTYTIGYSIGKKGIERFSKKHKTSAEWVTKLQKNGFGTVLLLRLAYTPFDVVGYIAGATKIPLVDFILGTTLGIIPGTLAFVLFGSGVKNKPHIILAAIILLLSLWFAKKIKRKK